MDVQVANRDQVVITIEGQDRIVPFADLGVNMDTPQDQILNRVSEVLTDMGAPSLSDGYGGFSYSVRKATNSGTIYVFPKPTAGADLKEQSNETRLRVYNMIISGCSHMYSKGKLQEDKFKIAADTFANLAVNDPIFLAHFTAWAFKKSDSKDLKVLAVFFNSLNDANGTPFTPGSDLCKPNFRQVSYALLQQMDPHLARRVIDLAHKKFKVNGLLNDGSHFSTGLRKAFQKYLKYRELNDQMLKGIRTSGLSDKMKDIYRLSHVAPSAEAAAILNWNQKSGRNSPAMKLPDFTTMTSEQIAASLKETRLSAPVAVSMIPMEKVNSAVAKALLKNCTGEQSIILYRYFSENGFLDNVEINSLFKSVASTAKTAVDRIETLTRDASESDKQAMGEIRSAARKKIANTSAFGKIYMHIDISSSMTNAIQYAKDNASIFAECVDNPKDNFRWGVFNGSGKEMPLPSRFDKAGFSQALYGVVASGSTDCLALYEKARKFGAEIDVYITDQGHCHGSTTPSKMLEEFHRNNPNIARPRCAVIVDFSVGNESKSLGAELEKFGMPVAYIKPAALKESALVAQAVANAVKGEVALIEEILSTELPKLPVWWNSLDEKSAKKSNETKKEKSAVPA